MKTQRYLPRLPSKYELPRRRPEGETSKPHHSRRTK